MIFKLPLRMQWALLHGLEIPPIFWGYRSFIPHAYGSRQLVRKGKWMRHFQDVDLVKRTELLVYQDPQIGLLCLGIHSFAVYHPISENVSEMKKYVIQAGLITPNITTNHITRTRQTPSRCLSYNEKCTYETALIKKTCVLIKKFLK